MTLTRKRIVFLVLSCFGLLQHTFMITQTKKAVAIVPVIDLVGSPFKNKKNYDDLPICGGNLKPFVACPRVHQLLFNEIVDIVSETQTEYLVSIPSVFYLTAADPGNPRTTYWLLKDLVMPLDKIKNKKNALSCFPEPISYKKMEAPTQPIITLLFPFYDPASHMTFSAGTRFVIAQEPGDSEAYLVYRYDKKQNSCKKMAIPVRLCLRAQERTHAQMVKLFLSLLRSWATLSSGYIPYGWGCSSFTEVYNSDFSEHDDSSKAESCSYFKLNADTPTPKTGFDCSSLIARAAQAVGIPYHCKNTFTIEHCLTPLGMNEQLAEGDIIIIPRHVMVVGSLTNNTLIEARSYPHGYGKVQELALNKVFTDINSYADLIQTYRNRQPISRMDIKGIVRETFPNVLLLRLESVWDNYERHV